jgi:uncharacterized protein YyaL (SSP411 family)
LVQSFTGGPLGAEHYTNASTYDNALIIDAYLTEGTPEDLTRAETIGNALLYVQAHDPAHDGRVRAEYAPTPLEKPTDVHMREKTSDVGNMAWVGQALVQLYQASGNIAYLNGAEAIGNWVQANARDTRGAGGYTGGLTAGGRRIKWKSTEHNIDLYALFTLLAQVTGEEEWVARAAWAEHFVEAMWEPGEGRFYTGTTNNGVTPENQVQPEDVNSWSFLALQNPRFASSVSWDVTNLAVTAGGFSGVSFCQARARAFGSRVRRTSPTLSSCATSLVMNSRPTTTSAISNMHSSMAPTATASGSSLPRTSSAPAKTNTISPHCTPARPPGTCSPPSTSTRSCRSQRRPLARHSPS